MAGQAMLKRRLATLRREAGGDPVSPPADGDSASRSAATESAPQRAPLATRLRRHGQRPSQHSSQHSSQRPGQRRRVTDDAALAASLGARRVQPGLLCIDTQVALDHHHGQAPLAGLAGPLDQFTDGIAPQGLLFYDTETTGLSGGVGTLAFMLGLARLEHGRLWVRQWLLSSLAAEAAMLGQAADWFRRADACISYNGLSFDLPLLAGRCRLTGVDDRYSTASQVDLLHPVRRAFAPVWSDCRLASVERRLLRFERRHDLPGADAPAAWLDFLQRGDPSRLAAVLRHNYWDLLSLAALLPALDRVYRDPVGHGADLGAIARHWAGRAQPQRAMALLRRHRDRLTVAERHQLAQLHRRRRQWPEAVALWEQLADQGDPDAIEALAKYHEHQCGNVALALDFARRLPPSAAREHRCRRLDNRLNGRSPSGFPTGFEDPSGDPPSATGEAVGGRRLLPD